MKNIVTKIVEITPDMAASMLGKNTMNRPVDYSYVNKYALAMKSGHWVLNGENLTLAEDGTILDGQHRLWAVLEAGIPVKFSINYNVSKDVFPTINRGKPRTDANVVHIDGFKNSKTVVAAVRLAYTYDVLGTDLPVRKNRLISSDVILNYARMLKDDGLIHAVDVAVTGHHHFTQGVMAFCHLLFSRKNPQKAEIFFNRLKTGEYLENDNPVLILRNKLLGYAMCKRKPSVREEVALYIKAWNAFTKGKTMLRLFWNPETDLFPEVK